MSQAMPRLSVLVPSTPDAPYLAETLESLVKQTFTDWELVLVLDGESEANRRIAGTLDPSRIRIVCTPHPRSGAAVARQTGLAACRGELLALCDADDLCEPERFERQVAAFDRRPELGLLTTWARRFDSATGADRGPLHCPTDPPVLARRLLLYNPVTTSSTMMRTALVRELGGFKPETERVEDYDLWLRFLGRAEVGSLPEELVRYRVHDGQYSRGHVRGPRVAIIRRAKMAAARRLGLSVPLTLLRHAAWIGVQVAKRQW
jgi:glycosyltransferase involved in cell wall biosynthesis